MYLVVSSFCGTVISIVDLPCGHRAVNKIALFYLVLCRSEIVMITAFEMRPDYMRGVHVEGLENGSEG